MPSMGALVDDIPSEVRHALFQTKTYKDYLDGFLDKNAVMRETKYASRRRKSKKPSKGLWKRGSSEGRRKYKQMPGEEQWKRCNRDSDRRRLL